MRLVAVNATFAEAMLRIACAAERRAVRLRACMDREVRVLFRHALSGL
jgi:hypothetical protein